MFVIAISQLFIYSKINAINFSLCRYPDDYLLVGEVLSFYLSRVLGVGHVPPVVLAAPSHPRWSAVASEMSRAGWGDAPVVVLTPWVERLVRQVSWEFIIILYDN